jgi:transglutaminase-like putative cysteine protease
MKYALRHYTRYDYSQPVMLEPHVLRISPRHGDGIQVHRTQLAVLPEPSLRFECEDFGGNVVNHVWFEGLTPYLEFTSRIELTTHSFNPFAYVVFPPEAARLPVVYPPATLPFVLPYLQRGSGSLAVAAFATDAARDARHETVPFLTLLTARLRDTVRYTVREEGAPYPPERTLKGRTGSCRDLAVLMMDACRLVGLAARFVSGYVLDHTPEHTRELHAWAEIYIPGGGWRGFDPSSGLAISSRHVPLASASDPAQTAPVQGNFRGDSVRVAPKHEIAVELVEEYVSQGAL